METPLTLEEQEKLLDEVAASDPEIADYLGYTATPEELESFKKPTKEELMAAFKRNPYPFIHRPY